LRESSGSTNIEKTLLKALQVLKLFNSHTMYAAALPFRSMVIHGSRWTWILSCQM
jgi:hypothetical protein